MGDPKRQRKKYETPRFLWRRDILQEELKLLGTYGLRNKHELWRHETALSKYRGIARSLIGMSPEERDKIENELLTKLKKIGILQETAVLDNVLDLTIEDLLERRLQTIIFRKSLAKTPYQARQLITHRHIIIGNRIVTAFGWEGSEKSHMIRQDETIHLLLQFPVVVSFRAGATHHQVDQFGMLS